jgi:hypothetical protein
MLITSTRPILGKTTDDDRFKPAIFKRYDFGYGCFLSFLLWLTNSFLCDFNFWSGSRSDLPVHYGYSFTGWFGSGSFSDLGTILFSFGNKFWQLIKGKLSGFFAIFHDLKVLSNSVGDPYDFFQILIRIRILFFRPIRIRIWLLLDPDPNLNRFGFGSESKLTLKTKNNFQIFKFFEYVFVIMILNSIFFSTSAYRLTEVLFSAVF